MKNLCLFCVLMVTILSSCNYEVKDLESTEFESIELFKKEGDGHLKGNLKFENPNTKTLKLVRADIEFFINQKSIGKIEEIIGEELKGKSPYNFDVDITFDTYDVYPGFLAMKLGSFGTTEVQVVAKGTIKSDLDGDKYDHEFEISRPMVVKR